MVFVVITNVPAVMVGLGTQAAIVAELRLSAGPA
jgi:hypothetical protein